MQQPPWADLELFLAIFRAGSLRGAAERTRVDVSTLSRRLAALEELLGATLFDRTRAGVVPTPLARALLEPAARMDEAANAFVRTRESFEADVVGEVRITVTPSVGDVFLSDLLEGLEAAHPKLSVVIDVTNTVRDIERRQADLALRFTRPAGGELAVKRLARLAHRLLAAPKLAAALGPVTDWGQVPFVLPEHGPVARAVTDRGGERVIARTDSFVAQLQLVQAGLAVAVLPTLFGPRRGLVPLRLGRGQQEPNWPHTELWLVVHTASRRVPRVVAMSHWLEAKVAAIVGESVLR